MLVYNINSTLNEDSKIYIVLYYQSYSKLALLIISSLGKQDLIFNFK